MAANIFLLLDVIAMGAYFDIQSTLLQVIANVEIFFWAKCSRGAVAKMPE